MSHEVAVHITVLEHGKDLPLPSYETEDAAGMDMRAALEDEALILEPGDRTLVPTGISVALPKGFEAQIRPRSGLAVKHGVSVLNSPGTIDADYRGEIKIALINLGRDVFEITHGMRIAQMIIAPVARARLMPVIKLEETARGSGGFGSTGS